MRLVLHYARGSLRAWLKWRCSVFIRCEKCGRRRWAEEVVVNCGWCGRCFDDSFAAYQAIERARDGAAT